MAAERESIRDPPCTATSRSTTTTHFPSSISQPYDRGKGTVQGPQNRPGQLSGRARSASPSKDHEGARHSVERERGLDQKVEVDLDQKVELDLELELIHDGPNRSVHPKFALCPSNLHL